MFSFPKTFPPWDSLNFLSIPYFINSDENSALFYVLALISILIIFDTMKYN